MHLKALPINGACALLAAQVQDAAHLGAAVGGLPLRTHQRWLPVRVLMRLLNALLECMEQAARCWN